VEKLNVSLEKAEATFSLAPGKELKPEVLRKAVLDAGFTPRDIFITARGNVVAGDGRLVFQAAASSQQFSLVENAELSKLKSESLNEVQLDAKVVGGKAPLSLEILGYKK
jgi:hypothetical protein